MVKLTKAQGELLADLDRGVVTTVETYPPALRLTFLRYAVGLPDFGRLHLTITDLGRQALNREAG